MKTPATTVMTAKTPTLAAVVSRVSLLIRTPGPLRRPHPNTTRRMFAARLFYLSFLLQACGPERGAFGPAGSPPRSALVRTAQTRGSTGVEAQWPEASFSPDLTAPPAPAHPGEGGAELHAAFQTPCGAADRALEAAAASFARALSQGKPTPEPDEIALWLRQQGSPYVWPRAWALESSHEQLAFGSDRLTSWLASFDDGGVRR